jgi:hypothetical protein
MKDQVHGTVEAAVASISSKAPAAGSVVTVGGWATGSDFGMWVGIAIGVLGLLISTYYKRKRDRRAEEAHRLYIESLKYHPSAFDGHREEDE